MRTYVITGAGSGIGLATRRRLESNGARVIGVDIEGDDVVADLATAAGRASMVAQVTALADGVVDAVIACAGLGGSGGKVVQVNYFGAVATLEGLRPLLLRASKPRAVVVASIGITAAVDDAIVAACLAGDEDAAVAASSGQEALTYTSSKRALARWIRLHAPTADWAGSRIPLNAVGPGLVESPMTAGYLADPSIRSELERRMPQPLGWPATADQIAPALDWLTSEENSLITGQCLFVDGGLDALRRGDDIW